MTKTLIYDDYDENVEYEYDGDVGGEGHCVHCEKLPSVEAQVSTGYNHIMMVMMVLMVMMMMMMMVMMMTHNVFFRHIGWSAERYE